MRCRPLPLLLALLLLAPLPLLPGCDVGLPLEDSGGGGGGGEGFCPPPPSGAVCYEDSDCVPDACCGEAQCAVFPEQAPSCSNVSCSGDCPPDSIDCGCGVPYCRDGRCTVARTSGPGCAG
jgi:hypothetical protein